MSGSVAGQRAHSQLRYLKQAVERFEQFHAANFKREIREFEEFFTQDDVVGILWGVLHRRLGVDVGAWHSRVQKQNAMEDLPADPVECLAFRFATLRLVKREKLDLRYLVSNLFPGAHLNEKLMHWKRLMVHPLAADCHTIADALLPKLAEEEWVDLGAVLEDYLDGPFQQAAFGPRAWTEADDEAWEAAEAERKEAQRAARAVPAAAARASDPRAALCDRIAQALEGASVGASERKDLLLDVEALRLELRRSVLARGRIKARLAVLAAHAPAPCAELEASL